MKYRKQKWKSRRQLHPLYERILRNHLHNLTQQELSALENIFEQLPENPQDLTPEIIWKPYSLPSVECAFEWQA